MAHVTINPDNPNAWMVILKEGETTFGRAEDNDVRVEEGGVSSHHCRVSLNQGVVTITDLNSTNGTSINGTRITQTVWNPGQVIHLGSMPVRLEGARAAASLPSVAAPVMATAAPASPPIPPPMQAAAPAAAPKPQMKLRISGGSSHAPAAPAAEAPAAEAAAEAPPTVFHTEPMIAPSGTRCKAHQKSLPRWHCPRCQKFFCDLCVTVRPSHTGPAHHLCRACGVECQPVQTQQEVDAGERGFFARLPGAFIYPLKGLGVLILIFITIVFVGSSMMRGMFSFIFQAMATGYLFLFMQNIIHCSAAGDEDMPSLPDFSGLLSAFLTFIGTIAICFVLPLGLLIAKLCNVEIPASAIIATVFLSLLYFPMAFLSVAMNDSVMAVNPLIVVPAILKVPMEYLVTTILLCAVFGLRIWGDKFASAAGDGALSTTEMSTMFMAIGIKMVWSVTSIYLLTVSIRFLGILYLTQKEKLGWF